MTSHKLYTVRTIFISAEETLKTIDYMFPEKLTGGEDDGREECESEVNVSQRWQEIPSDSTGYITTTALTCIDYLSAACGQIAQRRIPLPHRYQEGKLRVIGCGPTFETLLDEAFDQIRESARGNTAVILRMIDALTSIARRTTDKERLRHITAHATRLKELSARTVGSRDDRARIEEAIQGLIF